MVLRWGIVSTGFISNDFVGAVQTLPENEHEVVAVSARQLQSAQAFAAKYGIKNAYEGYKPLSEDNSVDIVYVGTLNPQHYEVTKLMLQKGKHVLCEKPLTLTEKHTRELVALAREKKLLLMEGVWSRSFPAYEELEKQIKSGAIGDVLYVRAEFGAPIGHVERVTSKELGGGSILDLGVYVLQFQQFVYRGLTPKSFLADGHLNENKVDESGGVILTYSDKRSASVFVSAAAPLPNEAVVVGTKGILKIPTFWCPVVLITPEQTFNYELPKTSHTFNFQNSAGLAYEAEEARKCIAAGKIESSKITHEESIQLAHYMDTWRKAVGNIFVEDSY